MSSSRRFNTPNFVAVWPAMFAISLGLMAVIPTLGLYVEERFGLHGEALQTWTGWIYAAGPLTAAIVGPAWGVLGDRMGRKAMLVRACLAIGVATACMPLASSLGWLLALRILQGAFAGFIAPAMALGTADTPPESQGLAISRMQLALALGLLVGPALGAEMAVQFGRASVFYFTSALSLLAVLPVVFFVQEDRAALLQPGAGARRSLAGGFIADLWTLLGNRIFVALLFCIFLLRFGQHMVEPFIALFVTDLGALPLVVDFVGETVVADHDPAVERTIAVAFVVLAVAQLLFTTRWGRLADRVGPLLCMAVVGLGLGVVFLFTASCTSIVSFMFLRCVAAVLMAGGMTLAYAAVAKRVSAERRSLAFTLVQSGMQFGLSLGPVFGDAVAAGRGMGALYTTGGICLLVAGSGMLLLRRLGKAESIGPLAS